VYLLVSHSLGHASSCGSHEPLPFHDCGHNRGKWNYPCCKLKNARRGAKLRFCYTWKIKFVLSDVTEITKDRGPPSCKANKLIRFSPVASVLYVTVCSKFVRDGNIHHFEWNRASLYGLQAEYKQKR
jgi:hypothetical protein